ncbi:lck-interacting transmembrane adapter 1 isoform X1 [Diceros bicornis minor]|uniref:lck-interacting transmembrane adapter 1 isoform X1 n=1 Tax=Diceros bicornis minor TaxID=77932 RepID=UPI0026EEA667|nr:lck-interacting transmembrane adapter 1 isoform X1 [Diceros bicornis minor]XP_058418246.1 lck-interacting transmembrane adapter 1 isoform X1 [Diceros bicornis minor]
MGPQVPSVPPALWVLGCLVLLLWLWALCTACHRKQVQRQRAGLQGSVVPAEASLLRRPHLCSLSKSDTRLHELHGGPRRSRGEQSCEGHPGCREGLAALHPMTSALTPPPAPRPVSMDLLRPQWLEESRDTTRPLAAFSHRELPQAPSIGPEATYSNVGLASIPRASLAANPVVWAGARLTSRCARPRPEARPMVAEYACIQKLQGTGLGPQAVEQGKAQVNPAAQVDILYSRVNKSKRRNPGPATHQPAPKGGGRILALGSDLAYEALPLTGQGVDNSRPENVYESIQEIGGPEHRETPPTPHPPLWLLA